MYDEFIKSTQLKFNSERIQWVKETIMLGISVFLGEDLSNETKAFIREMNENGFTGVFSSLHIPEDDVKQYLQRLEDLGRFTKKLGMDLTVDISGAALSKIGLSFKRPSEILATGITGLRMDYAIENKIMAELSQHMKVALNASTITKKDVAELQEFNANFDNMEAWHNYYPRPETGLGKEVFVAKNQWLKELGFRVMAFVSGNKKLRGPLFSGLPTLEKHRFSNPLSGMIELKEECHVDDVYLGDPEINSETMNQFNLYQSEKRILLHAIPTESKSYLELIEGDHQNRFDPARDVIRSADARFKKIKKVEAQQTVPRKIGSVTIDNQDYGRYMGEIQISLVDLPSDEKVNVVAVIVPADIDLLKQCSRAGQLFRIQIQS